MNFQSCRNTSDAVPLYLPQQLFLKPLAKLNISVQLPTIKADNTISNWEVMEKLRNMIKPEEFCALKVATSTIEFIRFDAEIEDKSKMERIVSRLDNNLMRLSGYAENLKVRASEMKSEFPSRHSWDAYFRDATNMDEMKAGERPDTIHIANLPIQWFVPKHLKETDHVKPSENLFHRIFHKFGDIRYVDIPICDPYRNQMKAHMSGMQTFTFDQELFFEGYVQFRDYMSFVRAMDAFRNMKLLHKEGDKAFTVNIKVDFDKTKHLSDASIRRRQIVRDRLVMQEKDREEKERKLLEVEERKIASERQRELDAQAAKEKRKQEREERRKLQHLSRLKASESEEINRKIALEEKKLLLAHRKLQAIRLVEELLRRMKVKKENELLNRQVKKENKQKNSGSTSIMDELEQQRERLRKTVEERETIKAVLGLKAKPVKDSDDSDSTTKSKKKKSKKKKKKKESKSDGESTKNMPEGFPPVGENPYLQMNSNWYGYSPMYPAPAAMYGMPMQGPSGSPGFTSFPPNRGRGFFPRRRAAFNPDKRGWRGRGGPPYHPLSLGIPDVDDEYYRYFKKLAGHDDGEDRSYSRSRSRSHSKSYTRSRSRSHKRSRSRSHRSRSHKKSRSKSYDPPDSYPTSAGTYGVMNVDHPGSSRFAMRGRGGRGFFPRRRGTFNPDYKRGWRGRGGINTSNVSSNEVDNEYYNYLKKVSAYDDGRRSYSRSRSRSRRRSSRRSRSYSRSRSKRRSRSRSRRRSYSRRSHSRSKSHSRGRSRKSRSRSRSRSRRRTRSRSRSKRRSRSKSKSKSRRTSDRKSSSHRSRSKSHHSSTKRKTRSPSYKSIDSSKFISPSRLRHPKSRSKSWSLPRNEKKNRSWSKSPENRK